jgi:hypothetical protein
MSVTLRRALFILSACALAILIPAQMFGQSHVVSPADLQNRAVTASDARQANIDSLTRALSSPKVEKAMRAAKIDPQQVKSAVSTLSNEELADLSARSNQAQSDFAGGTLSDRDLLLILVGIAALILIIVAVH